MSLQGKCAVITGSTAGQGALIAEALAQQGCHIILNGFGDAGAIEAQVDRLARTHGVQVSHHGADLQHPDQVQALIGHAERLHGATDILVNNAVVRRFAPVEAYRRDDWAMELAVNLTAPMLAIQAALPGMRRKGWGRIINQSSTLGLSAAPNRVGYVTTKTGIIGLTRAVAVETKGSGITCNALCASAMIGMNSEALIQQIVKDEGLSFEEAKGKFLTQRKTDRFVETLPAIVAFLCSEAGRDISGVALPVDMGSTAGRFAGS